MSEPLKPTVTRVQQVTSFNPTGQATNSYVVTYSVGEHGPFTITIPADQFTPATVKAEMDRTVATIQQLTTGA